MNYYEVWPADARFQGDAALTYSSEKNLPSLNLVTIPLRGRMVYGFINKKVKKPAFAVKPIKSSSQATLPQHSFLLAKWLTDYYSCSLGEALRQFTPGGPASKSKYPTVIEQGQGISLGLDSPLTSDQQRALKIIRQLSASTVLLHGDTGSGKTRVYVELAGESLNRGRSVILLVPEIALTSQLAQAVKQQLNAPVYVLHSQLAQAERKKIWLAIAAQTEPCIVLGPRSALFAPLPRPGLIVLDEAHEAAYQPDQSPRYRTSRVASQLAKLAGARVVLGTATPLVDDYYLAKSHDAIVRMSQLATGKSADVQQVVVDLKNKNELSTTPYFSKALLKAMRATLADHKQCLIYLNRRGTARVVMCVNCGWRGLCPRCDLPLVYHGDEHLLRCHSCGYASKPPLVCPSCGAADIKYRSAGTKQIVDSLERLFPNQKIGRFDSDNLKGSRLNELYQDIRGGRINILVGTQLLAKGLDLPKLGLVGIINADSSLNMPDFAAGERTFQQLYQVIGRVGRGHGKGKAVIQSYLPDNPIILSALARDYGEFYKLSIAERNQFKFPPFVHLMKLSGKYASSAAAEAAGLKLIEKLRKQRVKAEISEPAPSFYEKRGNRFYWQIIIKAKNRSDLLKLAKTAGNRWSVELDPSDLI